LTCHSNEHTLLHFRAARLPKVVRSWQ